MWWGGINYFALPSWFPLTLISTLISVSGSPGTLTDWSCFWFCFFFSFCFCFCFGFVFCLAKTESMKISCLRRCLIKRSRNFAAYSFCWSVCRLSLGRQFEARLPLIKRIRFDGRLMSDPFSWCLRLLGRLTPQWVRLSSSHFWPAIHDSTTPSIVVNPSPTFPFGEHSWKCVWFTHLNSFPLQLRLVSLFKSAALLCCKVKWKYDWLASLFLRANTCNHTKTMSKHIILSAMQPNY